MRFDEMYTEVLEYLPDSDLSVAKAKELVNRAYIQMAMSFQFYSLEEESTFVTTVNDYDYLISTVAAGAKDIIGLYNETDDCPLEEETIQWWEEIEVDPTSLTQAPTYWVRYADKILLHPTPDDTYTIRIRYKTNPSEMTNDSDSPVFPEEWHEAIVLMAASKAAFLKGFDNKGINLKNEHLALISALQEEHTMQARRRVGQISPDRVKHRRRYRHRHAEFD